LTVIDTVRRNPGCKKYMILRQVVISLLSNALKFTPQGQVVVRLSKQGSDECVIQVEDTESGIVADDFRIGYANLVADKL
jgi:signal transduction histidine kinase